MNPVELFEHDFAEYVDSPYAAAVCNGTAALHSALTALDVGFGSTVITTPYTFPATANAIIMTGAKPIFVDVKQDLTINPEHVEAVVRQRLDVKAILPVHIFGRPCDMSSLLRIRQRYGIKIVEDASQGIGGEYMSKKLGSLGDAGTYSFYASKNLPAYEGGMVVTPHKGVYERVKSLRNHGFDDTGVMSGFGFNYKMPWICAFTGWQYLKLHKPAIEAELGRYSEEDGYYPRLVYQHPWYVDNPELWMKTDCPAAEAAAKKVMEREKG